MKKTWICLANVCSFSPCGMQWGQAGRNTVWATGSEDWGDGFQLGMWIWQSAT